MVAIRITNRIKKYKKTGEDLCYGAASVVVNTLQQTNDDDDANTSDVFLHSAADTASLLIAAK